jgi:outer membrane protein assembly factor BamB
MTSRRASVPADVDGDGKLELVLGVGVYRLDGTALWTDATSRGGFIALGNFDADDTPELVVVGDNAIRLLDAENGHQHWSTPFVVQTGNDLLGGPPVIADFDGDGEPEIGTESDREYTVIDGDCHVLWTHPILDNSAFTGSVAFDFDGDGSAEVVQTDTQNVHILSGIDGSVRFEGPRQSTTGKESATVADIDGDGHAELIVPFDDWNASRRGIDVYGDPSWASAQPMWNQYDFTISNVNADGTVPSEAKRPWLEHNTYRAAGPPPKVTREPCGCQRGLE